MKNKNPMIERRHFRLYGFDGSSVDLPHTPSYPTEMWRRGKCWNVFCSNQLHVVKLNKTGKAMYGYCHHIKHNIEHSDPRYKCGKGQRWVYVDRGKLKEVQGKG